MNKRGLYWFTDDLRVDDNRLLARTQEQVAWLTCLYIRSTPHSRDRHFLPTLTPAVARERFTAQSVADLSAQLAQFNQCLYVEHGEMSKILVEWVALLEADVLFVSRQVGWYERETLRLVSQHYPTLEIVIGDDITLFEPSDLPFDLTALPDTFSRFRRKVEPLNLSRQPSALASLPPCPHLHFAKAFTGRENMPQQVDSIFIGGRQAGLNHLQRYFRSQSALSYKQTRNALQGSNTSTHFSPWLANGSLSVFSILRSLEAFELAHGSNDSTYWIRFELLWREYFHWYALKHGARLFAFSGINHNKPLTSYYPARFKAWIAGNTPYPIVNACMRELAATGFVSNRGRQLVASCLVNELALDWRFGASYFQHVLIDHDVGSNWGNWQYIAGVGADPRGGRHFDLAKQTHLYDPQGSYIESWLGPNAGLDFVTNQKIDPIGIDDWPNYEQANSLK